MKKLKAVDVEKLQRELQEEREKNIELKEKLKQKHKSLSSKLHRYVKQWSRINFKLEKVQFYLNYDYVVRLFVS